MSEGARRGSTDVRSEAARGLQRAPNAHRLVRSERTRMNNIIYIVGLVVVVIAVLSFLGLR